MGKCTDKEPCQKKEDSDCPPVLHRDDGVESEEGDHSQGRESEEIGCPQGQSDTHHPSRVQGETGRCPNDEDRKMAAAAAIYPNTVLGHAKWREPKVAGEIYMGLSRNPFIVGISGDAQERSGDDVYKGLRWVWDHALLCRCPSCVKRARGDIEATVKLEGKPGLRAQAIAEIRHVLSATRMREIEKEKELVRILARFEKAMAQEDGVPDMSWVPDAIRELLHSAWIGEKAAAKGVEAICQTAVGVWDKWAMLRYEESKG